MKGNEAQRRHRRDNAGKRLKLCSRCNQRLARHRVKDGRLCCECYVGARNEPQIGIPTAWRLHADDSAHPQTWIDLTLVGPVARRRL